MSNHTERWAGEHATPTPADIREVLDVVLTVSGLAPGELAAIGRIYRCLARAERPGGEPTGDGAPEGA